MTSVIIGMSITAVMVFWVDYITEGQFFWERPMFKRLISIDLPQRLQPHIRRINKLEKNGRKAIEAFNNLNEVKKKLNKDFKDDWDKQYRLLLPPPSTPDRKAVHFRYPGDRQKAFHTPVYDTRHGQYVEVDGYHSPVPVGAIEGHGGQWWYGFNNLPGHPNELFFIRIERFHSTESSAFWAFLPTISKVDGQYTWEDKKLKALAGNIMESIRG